jgi:formate transporter
MDDDDQARGFSETNSPQFVTFDAILPPVMAARAEENGVRRVKTDLLNLFALSVFAGAFISFGAIFATTVSAGNVAIASQSGTTLSSPRCHMV